LSKHSRNQTVDVKFKKILLVYKEVPEKHNTYKLQTKTIIKVLHSERNW